MALIRFRSSAPRESAGFLAPDERCRWRRGTGIEPAWNVATRSTLDLKSRPGTSRGNPAVNQDSAPRQEAHVRKSVPGLQKPKVGLFPHGTLRCNLPAVSQYSLPDAARILSVSPARLRYWERTALVSVGSGDTTPTRFEFSDLVSIRGVLALLDQGVPLRRIRRHVEAARRNMPELKDPVRSLRVWLEGSDRIVVRHEGALIEPGGQAVLDFGEADNTGAEPVAELSSGPIDQNELKLEAEEWFAKGCELDTHPETCDQAVECYVQGLELDPYFADCHCNLGAVYFNRGERDTARLCFERCLEIEKDHLEANFNLGNLLEEAGEDQRALYHYRRAVAVDPLYPDLHVNLALLYEKLSRSAQSRKHWKRYLEIDASGPWSEMARDRLASKRTDRLEG